VSVKIRRRTSRRLRALFTIFILLPALLSIGCDEKAVRQLGSKVGLSGQDVSSAAITALNEIKALEPEDYSQRTIAAIVVTPTPPPDPNHPNNMPDIPFPNVPHDSVLAEIDRRIEAYQQFGKAYAALQQLSDKDFADQATKAQTELVNSINNLNGIPNLPGAVTAALPAATGIIVDRKQANAIKKFNKYLEQISDAYKKLWESDRQLWDRYFDRVRSAYVNSLKAVPTDRFDQAQLRKLLGDPYQQSYLVAIYKAREAARLDQKVQALKGKLDAVDEAFRLLNNAHAKLDSQTPGFADVNSMLDRIVTVLEKVFKSEK
jgi:hypothetical protein